MSYARRPFLHKKQIILSDNHSPLQILNNQFVCPVDSGRVNRSQIYLRGGYGIMPERIRNDIDRYILRFGNGRPSMAADIRRERYRQFNHAGYGFEGFVYAPQCRFILPAFITVGTGYNRKQVRGIIA